MTPYCGKLTIKKHNDGRYWLHDEKGVYDGPFQLLSDARELADRINKENKHA
jgi:hypothetical protein